MSEEFSGGFLGVSESERFPGFGGFSAEDSVARAKQKENEREARKFLRLMIVGAVTGLLVLLLFYTTAWHLHDGGENFFWKWNSTRMIARFVFHPISCVPGLALFVPWFALLLDIDGEAKPPLWILTTGLLALAAAAGSKMHSLVALFIINDGIWLVLLLALSFFGVFLPQAWKRSISLFGKSRYAPAIRRVARVFPWFYDWCGGR